MQIQANMKMAEIVHLNYHLLLIISRFGIRLGFGEKTVEQVCLDYGIDVRFFLEIINSYNLKNYFPEKNLQTFPLTMMVDYLRKSHAYYLQIKIPQVQLMLNSLANMKGAADHEIMLLIYQFFNGYKKELEIHIEREEEKVYPYVFAVEKAFLNKKPDQEMVDRIKQYSIDDYENEHDNVEDKLLDLKNILIKYVNVPVDPDYIHNILFELFRLEADLRDHARLEDKILVPKVKYMEKWILDHFIS